MSRTKIIAWNLCGIIFSLFAGTGLHFLYTWMPNPVTAVFSSVNESTWEHLKLLFFPMLFFALLEYFFYGTELCGFFAIRGTSILTGMLFIVAIFYTYTGVLGYNVDFLNIGTIVVSIIATYCLSTKHMLSQLPDDATFCLYNNNGNELYRNLFFKIFIALVLLAFLLCLVVFTFQPPELGLFQSP